MLKKLKRVGAFIYMPLLFSFLGYFILYIIGAPVINFTSSTVQLFTLNEVPKFDEKPVNLLEQKRNQTTQATNSTKDTVSSSKLVYPSNGEQFGEIIIDKVKINEPLYYGDSDDILSLGAGQYLGSLLPGEQGTTLIGGHNMPRFGNIFYLDAGDTIVIRTHYGEYTYQVTEKKVANYKDSAVKKKLADHSQHSLILYTCYPLDALGSTPDRAYIFADYVSGPMIDNKS